MFCRSLFVFSGVRVTRSLVLCVCFVDRLSFFFWSLFLFFFDIRILITPLVFLKLFSVTTFLPSICPMAIHNTKCRVSSDPIFLYFQNFAIFLIQMYLPKISYITSQNPIFFQNCKKKSWSLNFEWRFTWQIEAIQDINADTSIVFSWFCIAKDVFMWLIYSWIFLRV